MVRIFLFAISAVILKLHLRDNAINSRMIQYDFL